MAVLKCVRFKTKLHSLRVFLLGYHDRGKKWWGLVPKEINLNFLQDQPCLLIYSMILVKILAKVGGQQSLFFSQVLEERVRAPNLGTTRFQHLLPLFCSSNWHSL